MDEPLLILEQSVVEAACKHVRTNHLQMALMLGEDDPRTQEAYLTLHKLLKAKEQLERHLAPRTSSARLDAHAAAVASRQAALRELLERPTL